VHILVGTIVEVACRRFFKVVDWFCGSSYFFMGKLLTIPVRPDFRPRKRKGVPDPRYVEGQRVLVKAIEYLTKSDLPANRSAIELLSHHFRTNFRMSDSPLRSSI